MEKSLVFLPKNKKGFSPYSQPWEGRR